MSTPTAETSRVAALWLAEEANEILTNTDAAMDVQRVSDLIDALGVTLVGLLAADAFTLQAAILDFWESHRLRGRPPLPGGVLLGDILTRIGDRPASTASSASSLLLTTRDRKVGSGRWPADPSVCPTCRGYK